MMHSIIIFIDGIGIGKKEGNNPFYTFRSDFFSCFQEDFLTTSVLSSEKRYIFSIDPGLDVPGLPQSATGQTTIFTGINAAQILGQHLFGFPNKELRKILMKDNLLLHFQRKGLKTAFFNCYPLYAEELSRGSLKINDQGDFLIKEEDEKIRSAVKMISVSTILALSIQQRFFSLEDLLAGRTIYQDFTNQLLLPRFPDVPVFSPEDAADIILQGIKEYDCLLYEYFQTDKAGHQKDMQKAEKIVHDLDRFLNRIAGKADLKNTNIFLISDHGNFEDLSSIKHTMNNVPFFFLTGRKVNRNISSLTEIFSFISEQTLGN